jgi:hypothetical protein
LFLASTRLQTKGPPTWILANPNVRQKFREAHCSASAQCLRIVRRTFACLPDSPQITSPDQICVVVTSQKHVLYTSQLRENSLKRSPNHAVLRVPISTKVPLSPESLPRSYHTAVSRFSKSGQEVWSSPTKSRPGQGKSTLVESRSQMSPSLSPTLSFMALYLRSPGLVSWHSTCALPLSAKSMIWLWPSVCTRICADLDAIHRSPYWLLCSQNSCKSWLVRCAPC